MKRFLKQALLALALGVWPLLACTPSSLGLQLAGFGTGAIDGIWLWRSEGGRYVRQCRIDISDVFVSGGREVVSYRQSCLDDRPSGVTWIAEVERLPSNPQVVTLALLYQHFGVAVKQRASAFNAAGESALSSTSLLL